MICRHSSGDPACGSTSGGYQDIENRRRESDAAAETLRKTKTQLQAHIIELETQIASSSPDSSQYDVVDVVAVGPHLVVKATYPNCSKCAYEGIKVMVFLNVTPLQAMRWRQLDPHFREVKASPDSKLAPSPAARFPASAEGWKDAVTWATMKADMNVGTR